MRKHTYNNASEGKSCLGGSSHNFTGYRIWVSPKNLALKRQSAPSAAQRSRPRPISSANATTPRPLPQRWRGICCGRSPFGPIRGFCDKSATPTPQPPDSQERRLRGVLPRGLGFPRHGSSQIPYTFSAAALVAASFRLSRGEAPRLLPAGVGGRSPPGRLISARSHGLPKLDTP